MAGPGGSNEIIVKIVSQMKGDSKKVVDEVRKKRRAAEKSDSYQRTIEENRAYRQREANYRRETKQIADKRKQEAAAWRAKESQEKKDRDRQIKYEEDIAKNAQKIREKAEREEAKRKAAARRKEELARRKAEREAERASPQYIERQGYLRARRGAIAKAGRERYMREKGMALPGTPEYYEQQGYKSVDAAAARKAGREKRMQELGITAAAKGAVTRVRAAKAPPPLPGSEEEFQMIAGQEAEKARVRGIRRQVRAAQSREEQRAVSASYGKPFGPLERLFAKMESRFPNQAGTNYNAAVSADREKDFRESMQKGGGLIKEFLGSPIAKAVNWMTGGILAYAGSKIRSGVQANQSFRASQDVLTGLIRPGQRAGRMFSIRNENFYEAAQYGMSPTQLMSSTAAYARAMGEVGSQRGGLQLAKLRATTGMDVGESAGVLATIRSTGRKRRQAESDLADYFGVAFASGVTESTRQPEFVKAFSKLMVEATAQGARGPQGPGRLVTGLAKMGGPLSQQYAIQVAQGLNQMISGGDPMSSQAAFARMAIGYGRPGSNMDFLKAESIRGKGIMANPQVLMQFLDSLRSSAFGNTAAVAYQLRTMSGGSVTQAQAEKVAQMHALGTFKPADIFNEATAKAKTPRGAVTGKINTIELMNATTKLTDAFESLNTEVSRLARAETPKFIEWLKEKFDLKDGKVPEADKRVENVVSPATNKMMSYIEQANQLAAQASGNVSAERREELRKKESETRRLAASAAVDWAKEQAESAGKPLAQGAAFVVRQRVAKGGDPSLAVREVFGKTADELSAIIRSINAPPSSPRSGGK